MALSESRLEDYRKQMIRVEREIKKVIIGIDDIVELAVLGIFCRGHILLDGLPGIAKTTLCLAIGRALGGEVLKFEGRPDFTPSQFLYVTEPDADGNPKFHKGPLITKAANLTVTLLDEITRFVSQAQAFWFEIMNEARLTLPTQEILFPHNRIFATKNKVTRGETFEIPQPQLDRFLLNLELRYPDAAAETAILMDEKYDDPGRLVMEVEPIIDLTLLEVIVDAIQPAVSISEAMGRYMIDVVQATRFPAQPPYRITLEGVEHIDELVDNRQNASGISPRGAGKWRRVAKAAAFRRGSLRVMPEDVLLIAEPALAHRIFVNARVSSQKNRSTLAKDFLRAVLDHVEVLHGTR